MFTDRSKTKKAACAALVAFAAASTLACKPVPPSATAESVRITKEIPIGCTELGEVYGRGGGGGYTSSDRKLSVARNEIREKTAGMGGNWVVMDAINADVAGTSIAGRAFRCAEQSSVPPGGASAVPKPAEPAPEQDATPVADGAANTPASEATSPPAADDGQPVESVEERLTELKDLHGKKLITDEEYETRKAAILEEL